MQLLLPAERARKPVLSKEPRAAEDVLAERPWQRVIWRQGTIAEGDPSEKDGEAVPEVSSPPGSRSLACGSRAV